MNRSQQPILPITIQQWISTSLNNWGGVIVTDAQGKIGYISPKLSVDFFGKTVDKAIGRGIEELMPGNGVGAVVDSGKPQVGLTWHTNGRDLLVSCLPIVEGMNTTGAVIIAVALGSEIISPARTGIKNPEVHLERSKEQVTPLSGAKFSFDSIIGNSLAIVQAKRTAWDVAAMRGAVLIIGETGTGKEMFAHAIHKDSSRKDGPFVIINCAAIPENLIESELFGYRSGAFTGAEKGGKPGKFELANRGTVFLDEIGELPMNVQAKFLRVLEAQEIERVGGISTKRINIRVISATNANLEELVKNDKFRMDLYYRLNMFAVKIPPLRERTEDIIALSHHFITKFNQETGLSIKGLSKDALSILMSYHWPGNVRELKSVINKACLGAKSGLILPEHLTHTNPEPMYDYDNPAELQTVKDTICNAERDAIVKALELTGGNKKRACMVLDMNRTTFYKRLKEYGLL